MVMLVQRTGKFAPQNVWDYSEKFMIAITREDTISIQWVEDNDAT